jgi:hypothetical protein
MNIYGNHVETMKKGLDLTNRPMSAPVSKTILALCVGVGLLWKSASLHAQSVATVPEGYMTYTVTGGSMAAPRVSTFSLPMRDKVGESFNGISAGKIAGVTSNTITVEAPGWVAGTMAQPGAPYFVRIKNGTQAEGFTFLITGNTTNTLTVSTPVNLTTLSMEFTGSNASRFEIFPGDTLASFFGTGNADGSDGRPMGGSSSSNSDVVSINDGGTVKEFYFNLANNRWQEGGFNRNNQVIHPHMGITYTRRSTHAMSFTISGVIAETDIKSPVRNSGGSYISYSYPVDVSLVNSSIHNQPGWLRGTSAAEADNISVWDGTTWKAYFYHSGNNRWQEGNFNRNNVMIPAGRPIWIVKRGTNSGTTFWHFDKPYNLD